MAHLIDADKLRAEIERRMNLLKNGDAHPEVMRRVEGVLSAYDSLLSFLDTLQEPEVDLGKEIEEIALDVPCSECTHDSEYRELVEWLKRQFTHFYELGRKAK